jgi:uncharacterized membrane protein
MLWLVLAICAQAAGALAVHLDKIALDNFVKGFETTFVFAALFNGLTAVVCLLTFGMPSLGTRDTVFAAAAGALFMLHLLLYFGALKSFSALSCAVFYQMTPVFGVILALAANDSSITSRAVVAIVIVVAGSIVFSVLSPNDAAGGGLSFGVMKFMLPSAASLAVSAFLLDRIHSDAAVGDTIMVSAAGSVVFGLAVAVPTRWVVQAVNDLRQLPRRAWPSVGGAELLALAYQLLLLGALLNGPVAYVLAVEGVQPMIVLVIGVILAIAVPHLVVARPHGRRLVALVGCSVAILGGVALLATESLT